ncbi:MAG TPA: serine/threonine-protein kinase, partial [Blastocatellia bacterium]|nr:serine/threonine-protein kinase [Blastocatellia bacterium]
MNRRWQRIEQIFHEAVQTPKADRDSFLEQACGADESMRKEVELLLAQPPSTMSIMDGALGGAALRVIAEQTENRLSGRTLLQYEIGARIGAGGMGEVYVARDQKLDRKVALKLLPGQLIGTDDQVRALRQEARAASALNHPNIITVYDLGQAEQFDFIAMEFISGETLRQKLRGGRLPIKQSVDIAMQIASALAAAHREGIVHRDIKPENVMVRDDGLVKILDFGIAKLQQESNGDAAPSEPRLSSYPPVSGTGCGTVHYLSPEQARRESVDGQSDIFALGIVFYEMLAGKRPFNGDSNAETIDAILNGEPAALSDQRASIPVELQRIVSRSLNKNRNERYQSVTDMLADLAGLKERFERDQPRAYVIEQFRPRTRGLLALAALLASLAAVHLLVFPSPRAWLAADVVALALATGCASAAVYLWRRNRPQRSLAETGFHGLSPFQEEDRERFFGREQDTRALVRMTKKEEFRFGLLYGESGSGKTSIITAGLAPELRAAGFEIIVCRSSKDPLASLVESFRRRYDVVPQDSEQPEDYIARAMNSILQRDRSFRKLMVICDQFEEFFVRFKTPSEREPFLSFVERCQRAEDLPLSFLFCIRADVLHHFITAFDTRIPEPLLGEKRYGLRSFDEEQAEDVIEKTFAQCGLEVQREFRDLIARDLAVNGTVLPSELQILGSQLQFRRILTVADYLRAGGKERLLHGFVEDVVRSSPDRKTALAILPAMVSGEGVRRTITLDELVTRTQREQSVVETVLRHLEQARLIREVQENRRSGYELIHDYLIEGI